MASAPPLANSVGPVHHDHGHHHHGGAAPVVQTTHHHDTSLSHGNGNGVNGNVAGNGYHESGVFTDEKNGGEAGRPVSRALTAGGHVADNSQYAYPQYHRKLANPAPIGVLSFALTTMVLSLFNSHVRGISSPNVVLGLAAFSGGGIQIVAGILEFFDGNTFGATTFCGFGLFWLGYLMILVPFFGITGTYNGTPGAYAVGGADAGELPTAVGLYLSSWLIFTTIIFLGSLRSSIALIVVVGCLWMALLLLMVGEFSANVAVSKAGGWFGLLCGASAFYLGLAGLLTKETSYFLLPVGSIGRRH